MPSSKVVCRFLLLAAISILVCPRASAHEFDEQFEHWPTQLKINGRILVNCDMPEWDDGLERLMRGKRVAVCLADPSMAHDPLATALSKKAEDCVLIAWPNTEPAELAGQFEECDVVYWGHVPADGLESVRRHRQALGELIDGGKTLLVDQSVANWLGQTVVSGNGSSVQLEKGLGLIPDFMVEVAADPDTESSIRRLVAGLALQPASVGLQVSGPCRLILDGRKFRLSGPGSATFLLAANQRQPIRRQKISAQQSRRQNPAEYLVDMTEWRRDAIDRTLPAFPPAQPPVPSVPNGSLMIVGGGGLPSGLMEQFVELAGGEAAKLVYVPCSENEDVGENHRILTTWKRMGVEQVAFIHTKDRIQANTDEAFMEPLREATGIWFGGGRQWNFADSYYGTQTHALMKKVLERGGVIGGSSAGASIQARYLARATPIGNFRPMAPGYERGGLGFIGGVAIDQHFSQRRRQPDMTSLVNTHPQLLGIGIDETTAIIVRGSLANVVGKGRVFFYDRNLPVHPDQPDFIDLPAGSTYDLASREIVEDARKPE